MRSAARNKVCLPIDGKPAINRAIDIYNRCGIKQHVIVIGARAGDVVETVGQSFDNVVFAYQAQQLGTAHATRVGLKAVHSLTHDEAILLVAGDRIIEASVLEQFFDLFYTHACDLAVLVCDRQGLTSQGRMVTDQDGGPLAIVESADIIQRQVYGKLLGQVRSGTPPSREQTRELIRNSFAAWGQEPSEAKLDTVFGRLWREALVGTGALPADEFRQLIPEHLATFDFTCHDGTVITRSPDQVEAAPLVNTSVYLVRAAALRYALARLDRDNAQQEEYLSDIVAVLQAARAEQGRRFHVETLRVDNPNYVMGYNDPAELLRVEAYIQARETQAQVRALPSSSWYRRIDQWLEAFGSLAEASARRDDALWDELVALYGSDAGVIRTRVRDYEAALRHAANVLGPEQEVLLVRAPGRVNVMGRHIDHQGGNCNLMTFGYETLMVVHRREDDRICLRNVDEDRFGARLFSIGELVRDLPWDDWLSLVNSEKVARMVHTYGGDWGQYTMAAVLRLQKKFTRTRLHGMDIVVSGNVPMAAGLSSSSTLVVGTAEATIAVNQLDTFPAQLVDLCGEGEWFVGTRGGSADHAAVKLGQKGKVVKVTFFDFAVEELVPFPEEYVLAVCDSGIRAEKTASARDQFNHRISCYRVGLKLIKKYFPQYAPLLAHLRDVNVRTLGIPLSGIYRILLHLPEQATRQELERMLPDDDLETVFAPHTLPAGGVYPLRGVVLFGLAECERARVYAGLLKARRMEQIGRLMNVSHNGDRVASHTAAGEERAFAAPTSNSYLLSLMEDVASGDPERVMRAQLELQPGSYACSLAEIDRMVDIALQTQGVLGAQLAGAGLGGCMMVLTQRHCMDKLELALRTRYYEQARREPSILVCRPVAGSGVLMMDGRD